MGPTSVPPRALVTLLLSALSPVLHPVSLGQGRGQVQSQGQGPDLVTPAAAAATLQPAVVAAAATLEAAAAAAILPLEAAVVAMLLHQHQVCFIIIMLVLALRVEYVLLWLHLVELQIWF